MYRKKLFSREIPIDSEDLTVLPLRVLARAMPFVVPMELPYSGEPL